MSSRETFWELGNEFAAQGTAACDLQADEMHNYTNSLEGYNEAMRGVAFL